MAVPKASKQLTTLIAALSSDLEEDRVNAIRSFRFLDRSKLMIRPIGQAIRDGSIRVRVEAAITLNWFGVYYNDETIFYATAAIGDSEPLVQCTMLEHMHSSIKNYIDNYINETISRSLIDDVLFNARRFVPLCIYLSRDDSLYKGTRRAASSLASLVNLEKDKVFNDIFLSEDNPYENRDFSENEDYKENIYVDVLRFMVDKNAGYRMIFEGLPPDDDGRISALARINAKFRQQLAKHISPALNAKAQLMPQETLDQKKAICEFVEKTLEPLGLAVKIPKTPGLPGKFKTHPGNWPDKGRFMFDGQVDGKRKQVHSDTLPLLELTDASPSHLNDVQTSIEPETDWQKTVGPKSDRTGRKVTD